MPRKKKYENTEIVKGILAREANYMGDVKLSLAIKFIDLTQKEDREWLKKNIQDIIEIYQDAIKELED